MGDIRDPERDQQLPDDGKVNVQDEMTGIIKKRLLRSLETRYALLSAVQERKAYGIKKYGKPLQTHNGRDALKDAWEESLDLTSYVLQMNLEEAEDGDPYLGGLFEQAFYLLVLLTQQRLSRGDVELLR